jgi:uncharacterized protein (DUF433 family)
MVVAETQAVPMKVDRHGVIRVGGTRVRLDTVIFAFNEGCTAEEIVSQYPTLKLADVYAVIAYYLNNRVEIDAYLSTRVEAGKTWRQKIAATPEY